MSKKVIPLFVALAILLACGTSAFAQSAATATITGRVVDPQGAAVPSATVVARNVANGITQTTTTTKDGLYRFPNLQPGTYDVTVQKSGFANAIARSVHINVGDMRDQNYKLALASASENITVTAEAPLIETTRTDVSSVVDEKEMRSLPVTTGYNSTSGGVGPSNDYATLAATAPGVRYDFSGNTVDLIAPGAFNNRGNVYNIDGGNITDQVDSGRDTLGASLDEVQEFQVLTNNYNAEYGQAGAMIVNVITKSGSNAFHGDGHAYFRGRNLSASSYFYNLGLFQASPSDLAAAGCKNVGADGSLTSTDGCARAPFQKQEWGFTAGGPFIKDRTFWFGSFEHTHQAETTQLTPPTGVVNLTQPIDETLWSVRLDHKITNKNLFTARFNQDRLTESNLIVQTPNNITPDSLVDETIHDHTLNMSLTSTIRPTVVNEARFFWHRFFNLIPTRTSQPGQFGSNFYTGADFCCPQGGDQNRYQGIDNLSWVKGSHTLKAGVSISYFPYISIFQQFHFGAYDLDSNNRPVDFVIGLGPGTVNAKDNIYGWYVQDTWKVRPSFTLNYGLRYDYEAGAFRGGTIFRDGTCFQSNNVIPACSSDKNNFQPRIGFTWSPFGDQKTIISASFAEVTEMAFLNVSLDSLNFDGKNLLTATFTEPQVLASFPNAPPLSLLQSLPEASITNFGRVRPISPNLRNPEDRHVNFSIRREVSKSTAVEVDYVGVFGNGQFGERDVNFPAVIADPAHPGFFYLGDRPNSAFGAIRTNQNTRTSHYNGMIASVQRRLASHLQFNASYTWSKTLSSAEDFYGTSEPANPLSMQGELAPSLQDIRHLFNYAVVVDTSKLSSGSGFLSRVVNNWSLSWAGSVQSGRPYPISSGDGPFASDIFFGVGSETQQRPNVGPGGVLSTTNIAGIGSNYSIAGITAPAAPANANPNGPIDINGVPVDFQFLSGNLARNAGRGSGYARLDFSLMRGFQLGHNEQRRVELKADFFNILNHTNFVLYNSNDVLNVLAAGPAGCRNCLDSSTGQYIGNNGQALRLQDLQHGKVDSNLLNPNWGPALGGIGDPAGTDIPRQIQLSVRFRW